MFSPRHQKGLPLLVNPPPPPSSRGIVSTVTYDDIAKEQRGDSGVYATKHYNVLI